MFHKYMVISNGFKISYHKMVDYHLNKESVTFALAYGNLPTFVQVFSSRYIDRLVIVMSVTSIYRLLNT